jgi:hypothetical protein
MWLVFSLACGARSGLRFEARDAGAPVARDAAPEAAPDDGPPPPPECDSDGDCVDSLFCNGEERCLGGSCIVGTFVFCPSDDPCFTGSCDEESRGCVYGPTDADRDGHRPPGCGDDCDDTRREVYPGASEICDYLDDDCDGEIDEGLAYEGTGDALDLSEGQANGRSPDMRFDGGDFDVVFDTYPGGVSQVFYVEVQADGSSATAPAQRTFSTVLSTRGDLEWNGSEYGLFEHYHLFEVRGNGAIALTRLDVDGGLAVDAVDLTDDDPDADVPSAAWSGADYGVAYVTNLALGGHPVRFVRVAEDGAILGADWLLSAGDEMEVAPSVAWTGTAFAAAYSEDGRIHVAGIDADGETLLWVTEVGDGPGAPSAVWNGTELGVAWGSLSGPTRFARLADDGALLGVDDLDGYGTVGADLVWNGREWGVAYQELDPGGGTFFVRIGPSASWISPAGEVDTESRDDGIASVDFAGSKYGVAYTAGRVDSGWVSFRMAGCPR